MIDGECFWAWLNHLKKPAEGRKNWPNRWWCGKSQKVWNYHRLLPLQFVDDETQITIWSKLAVCYLLLARYYFFLLIFRRDVKSTVRPQRFLSGIKIQSAKLMDQDSFFNWINAMPCFLKLYCCLTSFRLVGGDMISILFSHLNRIKGHNET